MVLCTKQALRILFKDYDTELRDRFITTLDGSFLAVVPRELLMSESEESVAYGIWPFLGAPGFIKARNQYEAIGPMLGFRIPDDVPTEFGGLDKRNGILQAIVFFAP